MFSFAVRPRSTPRFGAHLPVAALVALTAFLMAGPSALAADPPPGDRLEFGSRSNMCLEIYNFSKIKGAELSMWECKTSGDLRNQQWYFVKDGPIRDGRQYFHIRNKYSGLCVNIRGQSQDAGARAIQWDCNEWDPNGFFAFVSQGSGYNLKALHSHKCLAATSLVRYAPVEQNECTYYPRHVVTVRF